MVMALSSFMLPFYKKPFADLLAAFAQWLQSSKWILCFFQEKWFSSLRKKITSRLLSGENHFSVWVRQMFFFLRWYCSWLEIQTMVCSVWNVTQNFDFNCTWAQSITRWFMGQRSIALSSIAGAVSQPQAGYELFAFIQSRMFSNSVWVLSYSSDWELWFLSFPPNESQVDTRKITKHSIAWLSLW